MLLTFDVAQFLFKMSDTCFDEPAIGFNLGFAGTLGADSTVLLG